MQKLNEKQGADKEAGVSEQINDFIQKNRKPIFITAALLFVVLIAVIAAFSLMDMFRNRPSPPWKILTTAMKPYFLRLTKSICRMMLLHSFRN